MKLSTRFIMDPRLLLLAVIWLCSHCDGAPVEDRDFEGRFFDKVSINVLCGTDATFDYTTYPFNATYRLVFDKLTSYTPTFMGSCIVGDDKYPCKRTMGRVTFLNPPDKQPYVILSNVTEADVGQYRTRVIKENVPINPELIDIETTVNVYQESDCSVLISVTNVPEAAYNISLDQNPFSSNKSVILEPGLTHTWSVKLRPTSPLADISITQWTGNTSKPSSCVRDRRRCSESLTFSSNSSQARTVSVNVNFKTQNVPDVTAHFPIILKKTDAAENTQPPSTARELLFPLFGYIAVTGGLLVVFLMRYYFKMEYRKYRRRLMAEERTPPATLSACLVQDNDLTAPEYMYRVKSTHDPRSFYAQRDYVILIKLTTALMNTCGGVITFHCKQSGIQNRSKTQIWYNCYKTYLEEYVPSSTVTSCIGSRVESNKFTLQVLPSKRFACLDDGLSPKGFDHCVTDEDIINLGRIMDFMRDDHMNITDEHETFFEKMNRAKCVPLADLELTDTVKTMLSGKIKEYIKEPKGGDVLLGVNDDDVQKQVQFLGFDRNGDIERFSEILGSLFENAADICGDAVKKTTLAHWYLTKIHIHNNETTDSHKFFLKWHIYGENEEKIVRFPTAYGVSYDGSVFNFTLEDFHDKSKMILQKKKKQKPDGDVPENTQVPTEADSLLIDEKKATYVHGNKEGKWRSQKAIMLSEPHPDNNYWYRDDKMKIATEQAIRKQVLSWTHNALSWSTNIDEKDVSDNDKMLSSSVTFEFIPPMDHITSLVRSDVATLLAKSMSDIKKCKKSGYGILLKPSMFGDDYHDQKLPVDIHELYFVIFLVDKTIEIVTFRRESDSKSCTRVFILARKVKRKLTSILFSHLGCCSTGLALNIGLLEVTLPSHPGLPSVITDLLRDRNDLVRVENPSLDTVSKVLYKLALATDATMLNRLGAQELLDLSDEQLNALQHLNKTFNILDGPPGSGKSMLAIALYKQQQTIFKDGVLFAAPGPAFIDYCKFQEIDENHTILLNSTEAFDSLIKQASSHNIVIVDDVQQVKRMPNGVWCELFKVIHNNESKLYLFGDSVFQTYMDENVMRDIRSLLTTFCVGHGVEIVEKKLTEVRRNCKKVFNFMVSHRPENAGLNQMTCPHKVTGDDILIYPIDNYKDVSNMNGIIHIVNNLMGGKDLDVFYDHEMIYRPSDIALLIDGDQAEEEVQFFLELVKRHLPDVNPQRASAFPVRGIIIETLDNFCGLESNACIFLQGSTTNPKRNMQNERYKIYIASRGVQLVVFAQSKNSMTIETSDRLHFDRLDRVVNDHYSGWIRGLNDMYVSISIININGHLTSYYFMLYVNFFLGVYVFVQSTNDWVVSLYIKIYIIG